MKTLRKAFKIKKISLRISLYFSGLLIMIALTISFLNIRIYSDELSKQIDNVVFQKLSLINGKLNKNLEDIKSIHSEMINDTSIRNAFQNVYDDTNESSIKVLTTLIDRHPSIGSDNKTVIALGLNGEIYNPINKFPAYQALTNNNNDFNLMIEKKQYFRFSTPNTFPLEYSDPTDVQKTNITLFAQYYNYDTMSHIGYLAINFRKKLLFDVIDPLARETFDTLYIVDDEDNIIYQVGNMPLSVLKDINYGKDLNEEYKENTLVKINKKEYSVLSTTFPSYERWRIITIFDRGIINVETKQLNQLIYLILLVALLIMIVISWIISQKITNPIREVVASMKEFEKGQWPEPLTPNTEDEIKDLIYGYNGMLTSFIKLTDDMIARHQENKMIELDLINTQISLLEAQINPHFIHNTLNSMNYLALKEGNHELSTLIESFNKLLRMSMAIDVSFVTITQEIENIKDYAKIQSVRFEDAFVIEYMIDPEANIGKIPKLILQPIVENSIIHGILPMSKIGSIVISIEKRDDELIISISDNGIGIEEKELSDLITLKGKRFTSKHIGVQNVVDRLSLYYGENFDVHMESQIDTGTTIILTIPYED